MSVVLLAVFTAVALPAWAGEDHAGDSYPVDYCIVSGEKLGDMGNAYVFQYEGREVRFCCRGCKAKFLKDPAKYLKKLDDAAHHGHDE